jgi:hypothetical protein
MNTITKMQTMNAITKMDGIGPGHGELVPSRYALRVGEIDVLVISDGVVTPPAESMATNADPAVRAAWLDAMFLSRDAFDWALNAVVVRSGGRTILIDSGLGVEVPDFPRAGHLVHRLEAAGIDLASVTVGLGPNQTTACV